MIHESHHMEPFIIDPPGEDRRVCSACEVCTCHGADVLAEPCTYGE